MLIFLVLLCSSVHFTNHLRNQDSIKTDLPALNGSLKVKHHRKTMKCFTRLKHKHKNRLGTLYLYYCIPNRDKQITHTNTHTKSTILYCTYTKHYHLHKGNKFNVFLKTLEESWEKNNRESISFSNRAQLVNIRRAELNVQLLNSEDAKHYKQYLN